MTPENFDSIVDGSRHVLIKFFAPWCGHCKTLAPVYEDVAEALKGKKEIVIAEVDADKHRELGTRFGITGFPTMKWFPKGSTKAEDYSAGREADDILGFIKDKTGIQSKIKAKETSVKVLDSTNFKQVTSQGNFVLVEFYARKNHVNGSLVWTLQEFSTHL